MRFGVSVYFFENCKQTAAKRILALKKWGEKCMFSEQILILVTLYQILNNIQMAQTKPLVRKRI